jgi:hypothetical protein
MVEEETTTKIRAAAVQASEGSEVPVAASEVLAAWVVS